MPVCGQRTVHLLLRPGHRTGRLAGGEACGHRTRVAVFCGCFLQPRLQKGHCQGQRLLRGRFVGAGFLHAGQN